MREKVYCVMQSEYFDDGSYLDKIFKDESKAEKYCDIQNQIEPNYNFYVLEREYFDEDFNENVEVKNYYNYVLFFEEEELEENDTSNTEPEKQMYTYDNYVILYEESLDAYSTEGYMKAKEIAINERNKLLGHPYNTDLKYKVINKIEKYLPYDTTVCPICGGKIKHPCTGEVTLEQLEEDMKTCQLIEVVDENNTLLGYHAICKHGGE